MTNHIALIVHEYTVRERNRRLARCIIRTKYASTNVIDMAFRDIASEKFPQYSDELEAMKLDTVVNHLTDNGYGHLKLDKEEFRHDLLIYMYDHSLMERWLNSYNPALSSLRTYIWNNLRTTIRDVLNLSEMVEKYDPHKRIVKEQSDNEPGKNQPLVELLPDPKATDNILRFESDEDLYEKALKTLKQQGGVRGELYVDVMEFIMNSPNPYDVELHDIMERFDFAGTSTANFYLDKMWNILRRSGILTANRRILLSWIEND